MSDDLERKRAPASGILRTHNRGKRKYENYNLLAARPDGSLHPKVLRWVDAYTGIAAGDGLRAAVVAGLPYRRPSSVATFVRLALNNSRVIEEIRARYRDIAAVTEEEVLARRVEEMRGPSAYFAHREDGRLYLDTEALIAAGKGHLLRGIIDGPDGRQEVKWADQSKALHDIGEQLGLWGKAIEPPVAPVAGDTFNQFNFGSAVNEMSMAEKRAALAEFLEEQIRMRAIEGQTVEEE